jgi:hypothetical protein
VEGALTTTILFCGMCLRANINLYVDGRDECLKCVVCVSGLLRGCFLHFVF